VHSQGSGNTFQLEAEITCSTRMDCYPAPLMKDGSAVHMSLSDCNYISHHRCCCCDRYYDVSALKRDFGEITDYQVGAMDTLAL